ncbi:MAG: hypothetical protein GY739_11595 [Mesoflavibacter sp.]|nr:hypothetical protein [Mesoflavibacter sp.]
MIDINDPKSEFVFGAGAYTDRIKDFCRLYIVQDFVERNETFEKMKKECLNLKKFSEKHFEENINDINQISDKLISEIIKLEKINELTKEGNCKVCDSKLKTFDSLVKEVGMLTVCEKCPSKIYDYTNKLDWLTGAAFI